MARFLEKITVIYICLEFWYVRELMPRIGKTAVTNITKSWRLELLSQEVLVKFF